MATKVSVKDAPSEELSENQAQYNWDQFYDFYINSGPFREKEFYTHVVLTIGGILFGYVLLTWLLFSRSNTGFKISLTIGVLGFLIFVIVALALNNAKQEETENKYEELRISDVYKAYPHITYALKQEYINMK